MREQCIEEGGHKYATEENAFPAAGSGCGARPDADDGDGGVTGKRGPRELH